MPKPSRISPNRRWLIETPADRGARIWDLRDRPLTPDTGAPLEGPAVLHAVFSHDSATLATTHADGSLRIHSLEAPGRIASTVVRASGIPANRMQFSHHDGWLLAQSYAGWSGFVSKDAPTLVRLTKGTAPAMTRLRDDALEFLDPPTRNSSSHRTTIV